MTTVAPTLTTASTTTTTSYAQVVAAATAASPRVYLRVQNLDATDSLLLAKGATSSEVVIAKIAPGATFELKTFEGINPVPQDKISIKSTANTPSYSSTVGVISKYNLV